jgi:hypothetical protein
VKQRQWRGYFCWVCERQRPNERFSRWGRMRHVCRDCQRLPREELEFRQALRNIGRLVGFSTLIPRKKRAQLDRFLAHPDERVRACVRKLYEDHERAALHLRAEREREERLSEQWLCETVECAALKLDDPVSNCSDDDIPF